MRSTLLLAPLVVAAVTLAAPYTPWPDPSMDTSMYQPWSYKELSYNYSPSGGSADAVAKAKDAFETECIRQNLTARAFFESTDAAAGQAGVGCWVLGPQNQIREDLTFDTAYKLLWSPLLTNTVAALKENHIYDHKNIEDPQTLWNQACTGSQGVSSFNTTEGMAGVNQAWLYCKRDPVDITGYVAGGLDWRRVPFSETNPDNMN